MKKVNRKENRYPFPKIEVIKKSIEAAFPQEIKLGFYIKDFKSSSFAGNSRLKNSLASGVVIMRDDIATLRSYRKADSGNHQFDVDETEAINKKIKIVKKPRDIKDHHLNTSIPEDIMSTNNITLEVIEDSDGNLKLNINKDGTVKALVNFPDPRKLL